MKSPAESDTRLVLVSVTMAIAAGGMLVMLARGDGGVWAVVAAIGFLAVLATGAVQLLSRHLST